MIRGYIGCKTYGSGFQASGLRICSIEPKACLRFSWVRYGSFLRRLAFGE